MWDNIGQNESVQLFRVLHTVPGTHRRYGGPAYSVPALCDALSEFGHSVTFLTTGASGELEQVVKPSCPTTVSQIVQSRSGRRTIALGRRFATRCDELSLIHI